MRDVVMNLSANAGESDPAAAARKESTVAAAPFSADEIERLP